MISCCLLGSGRFRQRMQCPKALLPHRRGAVNPKAQRSPPLCRWHTWYLFAMLFIVPVFLAAGWVHKWRMGLIGMLIPLVVLLQYTW